MIQKVDIMELIMNMIIINNLIVNYRILLVNKINILNKQMNK